MSVREHLPGDARVSVVIPCYNQAHFLGDAIRGAENQSHQAFEIIVVDDGSTDDTAGVAKAFQGVRYLRTPNRGVAAARNAALAVTRGEYIVFADGDDRLLPNAIADGLAALSARPDCAFTYGHVGLIDEDGVPLPTPAQACCTGDLYIELLRHNYIWTSGAVLYRRSVFHDVGAFDVRVSASADFDLNARILRRFPACCHDHVVLEYRRHRHSMSHNAGGMLKSAVTARRRHGRFVQGIPEQVEALAAGIRESQTYYGDRVARQIACDLAERRWGAAVSDTLVLLQYHPRGFLRHLRSAMRTLLS